MNNPHHGTALQEEEEDPFFEARKAAEAERDRDQWTNPTDAMISQRVWMEIRESKSISVFY